MSNDSNQVLREQKSSIDSIEFYDMIAEHYDAGRWKEMDIWGTHFDHLWSRALEVLGKKPEELSCLDLGGGTGIMSRFMLERGARRVCLLEPGPNLLRVARKSLGNSIKYECMTLSDYAKRVSNEYDIVVANAMLHYMPCIQTFFAEVGSLARGSSCLLMPQNPTPQSTQFESLVHVMNSVEWFMVRRLLRLPKMSGQANHHSTYPRWPAEVIHAGSGQGWQVYSGLYASQRFFPFRMLANLLKAYKDFWVFASRVEV